MTETNNPDDQLLHLVFGGELIELQETKFEDLEELDVVGIFPNYKSAYDAWRGASQRTVDNAKMRYFIVHLHKLLDPENDHDDDCPSDQS